MTLTILLLASVLAADACVLGLLADVRLAIKRAGLTEEWVALTIEVPVSKFSKQMNGHLPFTCFWKFWTNADLRETDFFEEFLDIQARKVDRMLVAPDLSRLIASVEQLTESLRNRDEEAA